jgi:hypothetical protein
MLKLSIAPCKIGVECLSPPKMASIETTKLDSSHSTSSYRNWIQGCINVDSEGGKADIDGKSGIRITY